MQLSPEQKRRRRRYKGQRITLPSGRRVEFRHSYRLVTMSVYNARGKMTRHVCRTY